MVHVDDHDQLNIIANNHRLSSEPTVKRLLTAMREKMMNKNESIDESGVYSILEETTNKSNGSIDVVFTKESLKSIDESHVIGDYDNLL